MVNSNAGDGSAIILIANRLQFNKRQDGCKVYFGILLKFRRRELFWQMRRAMGAMDF
jgi:hypothetical protein